MMQERVNQQQELEPIYAAKAILNPDEFDNDKLWNLLYEQLTSSERKCFCLAAENTAFDQCSPVQFRFWPNVVIFYPELFRLLFQLQQIPVDMSKIISIFKECLIVPEIPTFLNAKWTSMAPIYSAADDEDDTIRNKFVGHPDGSFSPNGINHNINSMILAGFIAALGVAAIAVALVALNATTFGTTGVVVASVGAAGLLTGMGLFKQAYDANHKIYQAVGPSTNLPSI